MSLINFLQIINNNCSIGQALDMYVFLISVCHNAGRIMNYDTAGCFYDEYLTGSSRRSVEYFSFTIHVNTETETTKIIISLKTSRLSSDRPMVRPGCVVVSAVTTTHLTP